MYAMQNRPGLHREIGQENIAHRIQKCSIKAQRFRHLRIGSGHFWHQYDYQESELSAPSARAGPTQPHRYVSRLRDRWVRVIGFERSCEESDY